MDANLQRAGGIVVLFAVICSCITASFFGGWNQMDQLRWPHAVWLFITGLFCALLGYYLQQRPPRVLIDKATGKEIVQKYPDTLFFIPILFWGPIFAAIAIYYLIPIPHK